MNPSLQEQFDILSAAINGKQIQTYNGFTNTWYDLVVSDKETFNFGLAKYRIKPEPREFWICESTGFAYRLKDMALTHESSNDLIYVKEVI